MLRKEFNIDLEQIRDVLKDYGDIKIGKVFLNQYASEKLIEAIVNQGFEPVICPTDVDVILAIEGMDIVCKDSIDTIALVTRDADFRPLLAKANERGKETIVFGAEPGFSIALKNSADYVILLHDGVMEDIENNLLDDIESEAEDITKISKKEHSIFLRRKKERDDDYGGEALPPE